MRIPLLALLCMGTTAFCQSPGAQKIDPDKLFQLPDRFAQRAPDFKSLKPLPGMKNELIVPRPSVATPPAKLNNPQIDPKMIIHPPWRGQSRGRDFAHHLFPNLKFLPLQRRPLAPR
jgi:hypothetical protein